MWRLSYAPNMAQCPKTGDFFNNSPNKTVTIHRTKLQQFTEQNRHNSPKIWLNYCFTENKALSLHPQFLRYEKLQTQNRRQFIKPKTTRQRGCSDRRTQVVWQNHYRQTIVQKFSCPWESSRAETKRPNNRFETKRAA